MDESFIKNNINTYRKSKDLTQIEAAQALNISTNAYRKIEKGNTAIINSHVRELADLLEMSLEETIATKNEIITMLKKMLAEQK